jgi:subtilisin family serine protease
MLRAACALLFIACTLQARAALPISDASAQSQRLSPKVLNVARAQGHARVLVMLRDDAAALSRPAAAARKIVVRRRVDALLARLPQRGHRVRARFALVPAIALDADALTLQRLAANPDVLRIDLDAPGRAHGAPDAASVLNHVSDLANLGYGGSGMKVAVIDSGIDTDHADLASRIIGQACFCSNSSGVGGCCPNAQATQTGAGAAEDAAGHGTNVAGIIGGAGNIAPRGALPQVQLVAVRVLDAFDSFCCSSDIVKALDWVAANHPDVDAVNMSLGTSALFAGDCDNATAYTMAFATAIANLRSLGAVVVASSGNEGSSATMAAPACVRDTVSVGATWDFNGGSQTFLGCTDASVQPGQPTCFTNRSTTTDLYGAGAYVLSTGMNGGTSNYGGTSQAAPMVAACAAALKQAAPQSSVAHREDAMRLSRARVTDIVSGRSYPFLDCTDALQLVGPIDLGCPVSPPPPVLLLKARTGMSPVRPAALLPATR